MCVCVKGKGRGHFFGQGSSAPLARGQIDQNKRVKKIEKHKEDRDADSDGGEREET